MDFSKIAFVSADTEAGNAARKRLEDRYEHVPPEEADLIVALGGDGFMLSPIYCPGAIEEFVDLVVPELQRRGRFRREYAGATQRDHLNQDF